MTLSSREINEEVEFLRDICGWSNHRIENKLGLAQGTLERRSFRAKARQKLIEETMVEVNGTLAGVLTADGITQWWDQSIPALKGRTPREVLAKGLSDEVVALANSYLDQSFS